jgi:type IV pilus assembly protein PilY1
VHTQRITLLCRNTLTVALLLILCWQGTPAEAQVLDACPIPPFAEGNAVAPNILLILDHSGSMGNGPGSNWETAKSVLKDIIDAFPNVRLGLMRMDGSHYNGSDQISIQSVVRQGGKILRPVGTPGNEINAYIDARMQNSNTPQTFTVLAETLASAGQYFATVEENGTRTGKGPTGFGFYQRPYRYLHASCDATQGCDATITDDYGASINTLSPILYPCQKSFVIFITDGLSNYDNDWNVVTSVIGNYDGDSEAQDCPHGASGCSSTGQTNYLNDVAKYLFDHDMRSDLPGKQNLVTYVVGFTINDPLLSSAALQGGGKYYTANTADQLRQALQDAIQDILDRISSGTAVATISTSAEADDLLIRATFLSGKWKGFLEAFRLPFAEGDTPLWEAGAILSTTAPSSRHIFTHLSSATVKQQDFSATNATLVNSLLALWNVDATEAAKRIDYVRGAAFASYRDREGWLLGDIIHSAPLYIGPPTSFYQEDNYQAFKQQLGNRQAIVYVGANDGMLHAFDASDGHEVWGFIPEGAHPRLPALTTDVCHEYFVDLTAKAADVWDGGAWKTVLCGGNRLADGEDNWCLNITNPARNAVSILWDKVLFPNRKASTHPVIAKVKPVNKWVAIFTSGYDEGTNFGKIAAVEVGTGTKQAIWHDGGAIPATELDLQDKAVGNPYYSVSSPNGVDSDNDGYVDLIYAGDTEGNLWKLYYDFTTNIWKKVILFQIPGQPITTRPIVSLGEHQELIIYFGTGKYLVGIDKTDTGQNTVYALVEKKVTSNDDNNGHYTGTQLIDKNGDLVNLNNVTTQADFDALSEADQDKVLNQGWYFDLSSTGVHPSERVIGDALVVAGTVFFTSFTPNEDVCGFGGSSRFYALDYRKGVQNEAIDYVTDQRYEEIGAGMPSQPVFYFDKHNRKKKLFIQTSDTILHEKEPNLPEDTVTILYWRTIHN